MTQASNNIIDPPWFDGIEDMEPNDDFGSPKQQPEFMEACKEFRKYFENEPWFVRLLAPPAKGYIICVVDARYWQKGKVKVKHRPWRGYPVAVAILTGLAAQAEKNLLAEEARQQQQQRPDAIKMPQRQDSGISAEQGQEIIQAYFEKFGKKRWFIFVNGFKSVAGLFSLQVQVDPSQVNRWQPPYFAHQGLRVPVNYILLSPESLDEMEDHLSGGAA